MNESQRLKIKSTFDDFMQDMYDEEELRYMDSGFVNALWLAFYQAWCAAIESVVIELPDICDLYPRKMLEKEVQKQIHKAGIKYE